MKFFVAALLLMFSCVCSAQITCNGPGQGDIPGTTLHYVCAGTVTPPVVTPPVSGGSPSACSSSQTSAPLGSVTLKRQCNGTVAFNSPYKTDYAGPVYDLAAVLSGAWPTYGGSGYTPTYALNAGQFIAMSFTPTATGTIQLVANSSFGQGGLISVSDASHPGSLLSGQPGVICAYARNGANSMLIATAKPPCQVIVGQTYFINLAAVNPDGSQICAGGSKPPCSSTLLAYTLYTSAQ